MASLNSKVKKLAVTHEGAKTIDVGAKEKLKRTVMSCLLWEKQFYEDGISIAERIALLIPNVKAQEVFDIAVKARNESKLRHVPLLIASVMAKLESHKHLVSELLAEIIQRPDELTEFLAIYWKDGKCPISNQVKKGLAKAFNKFNEYQLQKYNRDGAIKLRDVLFLVHPKPENQLQQDIWNKLVKNELAIPDTWETEISKNKSNKESWERLLSEKKLGALALLRNMRNMIEAKVDKESIRVALKNIKIDKVLPFRFIASARYAPDYEPELEQAMYKCIEGNEKLKGKTVLLVDVSGSMEDNLSEKSDMKRTDAAYGLSILARELCEEVEIYSFSSGIKKIPLRRGFALRDAINSSQPHSSTYCGKAVEEVNALSEYDRMIIITDEQSHDIIPTPKGKGYIINVASNEHGIGYGAWNKINGWSESVFNYIIESEKL